MATAVDAAFFDHLSEQQADVVEERADALRWPFDDLCSFWFLCEGELEVDGRTLRVADVVLGQDGPTLGPRARDWIAKLSRTPLRAYLIADVDPGKTITLQETTGGDTRRIVVSEKKGSQAPDLVGSIVGARLIDCGDHTELSGELYQFGSWITTKLLSALALTTDQRTYSAVLRHTWEEQLYTMPERPRFVDVHSGEDVRLVTDVYACEDWEALCRRCAKRRDMTGDARGWTRRSAGQDGATSFFASVTEGEKKGTVEVNYQSLESAKKGRKWFAKLAGDRAKLTEQLIVDVNDSDALEAAIEAHEASDKQLGAGELHLPPEVLRQVWEQSMHQMYANFADKPLPFLGGHTPREMVASPQGAAQVRALLMSYEANEVRLAAQDGRAPISYGFLWDMVGLRRDEAESRASRATAGVALPTTWTDGRISPNRFRVNDAWIAFLAGMPVQTDVGPMDVMTLMDASSTFVFGGVPVPASSDVSWEAADRLLEYGFAKTSGHAPRVLLVLADEPSGALCAAAAARGIEVQTATRDELEQCTGAVRQSFSKSFEEFAYHRE